MSTIVLVDVENGVITDLSLQALSLARDVGEAVAALVIEPGGLPAEHELAAYGVERVFVAQPTDAYAPAGWATIIASVVREHGHTTVIGTQSARGSELLAHAAIELGAPYCSGVIAVRPAEPWTVTRQRWGGSVLEESAISGEVRVLGVAPDAVAAEPTATVGDAEVRSVSASFDVSAAARLVRHEEPVTGEVALGDAKVVVGAGRGAGGEEAFVALEELASLLGGVVGASRVVTNNGWLPHDRQIGQTGARIAPGLYIACGLSGAAQHMVGCKGAGSVLAINTDRDAPIVALADFAVIGDLNEVVPAVVSALKEREAGRDRSIS